MGFRLALNRYAQEKNPNDIIFLGQFFDSLLEQIKVKKSRFAQYIQISSRNINKYFSGERKFNIDHALKLEQMFNVQAEIFLEIQIKNDLLKAKKASVKGYEGYTLDDLLSGY